MAFCYLRHLSGGSAQDVVDVVVDLLKVTQATEVQQQQQQTSTSSSSSSSSSVRKIKP
jgi:hypothetical protein